MDESGENVDYPIQKLKHLGKERKMGKFVKDSKL